MTENPNAQIVPVGSTAPAPEDLKPLDPTCPWCIGHEFQRAHTWEDSTLKIHWNSSERKFRVDFSGKGNMNAHMSELLSNVVPLQIAEGSRCTCGSQLELGDYCITVKGDEFIFDGNYSCPSCKEKRRVETSGVRWLISRWLAGIKKLELRLTGLGIERE